MCLGSQGPSFWVSRSILLGKVSARRLQGWAVDLHSFRVWGSPSPCVVFVRWCQGHLLYVWLSRSGLRMVCLLAGDLPAHPELPPSPRTGYACDQCLLEHDRLCGGLCLWPVSGSSGGCGAVGGPWTPIRACHPVRTVKAGSRVFHLSAAWTTGWQRESGGGRGLEPRTRSAHRPALGSEPWAASPGPASPPQAAS